MFQHNINSRDEKIIKFLDLTKTYYNNLINQQLDEDAEFNLSNAYKNIIFLNTILELLDNLFYNESKFLKWSEIKVRYSFDKIRSKLAYYGYDFDTFLSIYLKKYKLENEIDSPIGQMSISDIIEVKHEILTVTIPTIPSTMLQLIYGLSSTLGSLTSDEYNNGTVVNISDTYGYMQLTISNIVNKIPYFLVPVGHTINSIKDGEDETATDYRKSTITLNGSNYYLYQLSGITSIDVFKRSLAIT